MTVAEPRSSTTDDPLAEVRSWIEENWDPDLSVEQWWERLGLAGWSSALLPPNAYGRGLSRSDAVAVAREVAKFGAVGAPSGLGVTGSQVGDSRLAGGRPPSAEWRR